MIDVADPNTRALLAELRTLVAQLALVSHAPTQGYDFAPSTVGAGRRWRVSDHQPPIAHLGAHHSHDGDSRIPDGHDRERAPRKPRPPAALAPDDPGEREAWQADWEAYQRMFKEWRADMDAWRVCYQRRIPSYFGRALAAADPDRDPDPLLRRLIVEARDARRAWLRSPSPPTAPEPDGFLWRCAIADADTPIKETARLYSVSARTVKRYRASYRGARSFPPAA